MFFSFETLLIRISFKITILKSSALGGERGSSVELLLSLLSFFENIKNESAI